MINQIEQNILNLLQHLYDELGWFGVTIIMIVENSTGIAPSEVVLALAGWMLIDAHSLPFSTVFLGGLFAAFGSVMGASILYWAARLGGRPVVERVTKFFRIDLRHMQRVERLAEKHGTRFIFFGRLIPGIRMLVAIPAGLTRMPYLTFAIATFLGAYLWCTVFISVGYFLGHEWHLISNIVKQIGPYAFGIAVFFTGIFFIWRRWQRQKLETVKLEIE
ncbi:MAG TPA: DedA family protein [Anaerolineales bacterium]|nr:DedA family protein [Anaerolineales bacterium]